MATEAVENNVEEQLQPKKHEHKQAAHLDKVTDYVEEQEISGHDIGKVISLSSVCMEVHYSLLF